MDNSKRAEKIHGTICNCTLDNPCGRSEWITSQLDEAVREACFKALDEAAALSREVETAAEKRSFKQGFALAREKAAGIAVKCCWDWNKADGKSALTLNIQERILAMVPGEDK